ncbi:MAG: hypothetical protein CM1200mP10_22010 [Candidatus Neomarinimicrobiota bacterium]|nr:MAG: hypothetical protein CM1200mP10_22010 [Candidatus Neomarinimicrobiota bacterium]
MNATLLQTLFHTMGMIQKLGLPLYCHPQQQALLLIENLANMNHQVQLLQQHQLVLGMKNYNMMRKQDLLY